MNREQHLSLLDRFSHIDYPKTLTKRDKELILQQCEIQGDLYDESVLGFALAYSDAKQITSDTKALFALTEDMVADHILKWASLIDKRNTKGLRTTEVRFANGNSALEASKVPRAMEMFCKFYASFDLKDEDRMTPEEYYREFEEIHPLEDGNGRLGDILWKLATARETGKWPNELPPDFFGAHNLDESA